VRGGGGGLVGEHGRFEVISNFRKIIGAQAVR
jgi:hypothetical protein